MIELMIQMPSHEKKFPKQWVDYGRKKRFELYSWRPSKEKASMGRIPFNIITEETIK